MGEQRGFPARLADRLATADPSITKTRVFAVPGETATGFLERRLDDVLAAIDELGTRVEVVTIGLGANELLRVRREPACEADPDGEACISAVSAATVEAAVAAATVVGTDGTVACDPPDATPGLNDRIACVAEGRGVEVVDLHAAFLGREAELTRIGDGDVHPNEMGHEVIAEAIADTLGVAQGGS